MTRVEFFFNVKDKRQKLVSISEKLIARGMKLMVYVSTADEAAATRNYLWQQSCCFLPNDSADGAISSSSPIVVDFNAENLLHDEVLINFQHPHPRFFSRFKRLIEIVGVEEEDKETARIRYKFYRDRGYEITVFDEAITGT